MQRSSRRTAILAVLVPLLFVAIGCGEAMKQAGTAAKRQSAMNDLKEVGLAFHNSIDSNNAAPRSWEDLEKAGLPAQARQAVETHGYKLILGISFNEADIGSSNFMLAYPVDPSGDAVQVLLMDGSVQTLSRQDFDQRLMDMEKYMAKAVVLEPGSAPAAGA